MNAFDIMKMCGHGRWVSPTVYHNITFSCGIGTWADDTTEDLIVSVAHGALPHCPKFVKAPTGYYSTGWYGTPYILVATEDRTYTQQYAILLEYNTVYFDLAGGTWTGGGAVSQSVADNGYATEPTCSPPISNHPDHRNFTWIGWDTALGPITGNTTITALWQMNDF